MRMRNLAVVALLIALAILLGPAPLRADTGSLYIGNLSGANNGGSFDPSTWKGTPLQFLYCVDVYDFITLNTTYGATDATNTGSVKMTRESNGVRTGLVDYEWLPNSAKVGQIAFLLDTYGNGIGGQSAQADSLQEAIWKVVYGGDDPKPLDTLASTYFNASIGQTGSVGSYLWFSPATNDRDDTHQALVGKVPVPEPTSIVLLGIFMLAGALGLGAKRIA